jgi:rhomboid protease GluP
MRFFRRGRKSENTGDAGEAEMTPRTRGSASARGPATSYVRSSQPASFSGRSSSEKYNLRANSSSQPASYTGRSSSETYNLRANNGEDYDVEDSNVNVDRAANKGGLEVDADYNLIIDGDPVYVVKQKRGYLSIFFSLAQTVIVVGMMIQCGVAPMKINPMVGPNPDVLSYWGAKNSYDILYEHEYWRLFSPIMLHAGIFHLLCNVAVQLDTGAFFEREWGSFLWLLIYLGSAAAGTILSVVVSPNTIGVGSSGAVCGLFGAKMAEAICRSRESTRGTAKELSHAILCEQCGSTLCSVILILVFSFIPCEYVFQKSL